MKKTLVYLNAGFFDTDVTVVKELAEEYDLHWFVVLSPTEPYAEPFFHDFVKGTNIHLHLYTFNCRRRSLTMLKLYLRIVRKIRKLHPSLIYSCCQDAYFTIPLKMSCPSTPFILGVHDAISHSGLNKNIYLSIAKIMAQRLARKVLLFSKNQHETFKELYPNKECSFVGMSGKDFGKPTIPEQASLGEKRTILFFGTLQHYKGYDLMIKAYERLLNDGIKNIRLRIYGRCGNDDVYNVCMNEMKHKDAYELHLDFVDNKDIPNIMASSNFCILPYRDATNSGPLMIAVSYGIPVIAPNAFCFKDVCTNKNAILYDCADENAVYYALKHVSQMSNDEYFSLREECQKLKEEYSESNIVKRYIKEFNEIIG